MAWFRKKQDDLEYQGEADLSKFSKFEKTIFILAMLFFSSAYGLLLALPWLLKNSKILKLKEELNALGTYGDMFGALNSLVTGFALLGVIYTSILQRKQFKVAERQLQVQISELSNQYQNKWREESDARAEKNIQARDTYRAARLNAISYLAQTYASIYSSNPTRHDADFNIAHDLQNGHRNIEDHPGAETDPVNTIKGKMRFYTAELESILSSIKPPLYKAALIGEMPHD